MLKFAILLFFFSTCCCAVPEKRIVGGFNPSETQNYVVSIRYKQYPKNHLCGGAILNKRWVLTAAYCIKNVSPERMTVYAGSEYINDKNAEYYDAESLIPHPNYEDVLLGNNIGLIKMKKDFKFSEDLGVAQLNVVGVGTDTEVTVFGFGSTSADYIKFPPYLLYLKMKTVDIEKCIKDHESVYESDICARNYYKDRGICTGDMGSPLVLKGTNILAGVASHSIDGCASGNPDVFARLSSYIFWILPIINS